MNKIFRAIKAHKIWTTIIIVLVAVTAYFSYGKIFAAPTVTKYVLGTVEKGTLIFSVSGSGQISASRQLDLKPKVSGDITHIGVKEGDEVKAGAVIAMIDDTDARKAVRDAEYNLISSKISLQKTKLQSSQSVDQTGVDLKKAYDNGFTSVADAFLDLPSLVFDSNNIMYNPNHSSYMDNGKIQQVSGNTGIDYKNKIAAQFQSAKNLYDQNLIDYKKVNRNSDQATIYALVVETQATTKALGDAIKGINNFIDYLATGLTQKTSEMTADQSTLNSYISKTDSSFSSLVSAQKTIVDSKNSFENANLSFNQSTGEFNGDTPVDVQTAELAVIQKQNALSDAQIALADYVIRAPFDGVVASISALKADSVSSATAVATLITKQQIATITLNEIDAVNVKVGQKATLTFDALPDLNMTGSVSSVDSIGTVTQGVVNYVVEISLDTKESQIKPGMSVSAAIITSTKTDVLLVPNSAIKSSGMKSTVQMLDMKYDNKLSQAGVISNIAPKNIPIKIGDSNDINTEVLSGLREGDQIVIRTVTGVQATAPSAGTARTNTGLFGTGGATRIPR